MRAGSTITGKGDQLIGRLLIFDALEAEFTELKSVQLPVDTSLVTIVRDGRVIVPSADDPLEAGDELLFVASASAESELQDLFSPHVH